jgi:hypothetical protein
MFIVAKFNFFDNVLTQEVKDYPSLYVAYINEALYIDQIVDDEEQGMPIDEIKQRYFDCDMMINILEVRG